MALSHKSRKSWALVILLIWMPAYVVICVTLLNRLYPDPLQGPPILLELAIYVALGVLCFLPFRRIFLGVGQADPDDGDG